MKKLDDEFFRAIRRLQIETKHLADDVLAGLYHSAFKGRGIEFEEVREFLPGDELRSIDWSVTARTGRPFVKLFKEERELTIILVVDISFSCRFGTVDKQKNQLIAEAGALLAFSAMKNNDKIGLVLFSDRVEKYLPPKKGLRHLLRVVRELLYYTPARTGTDIAQALDFTGKVHRRSSICFVLSDFLAADFKHEWLLLARKNDLIGIRVTSSYERVFPNIGLAKVRDLESGRIAILDTSSHTVQTAIQEQEETARNRMKDLCRRTGTGLIELTTEKPPLAAIKKFFKTRSHQWH